MGRPERWFRKGFSGRAVQGRSWPGTIAALDKEDAVAAIVSYQEAFTRRQPLMVADYTETDSDESYYVTPYFGALPANVDPNPSAEMLEQPQAYYVEQPPQATVPPHYHDTNQFQVFLRGHGLFGKKPVGALTVHYASGHTPYGPIVTTEREIHYLTLRNRWDSGGKTMPQCRPTLRRLPRRFRMVEDFALPELAGLAPGTCRRDDVLPCEDDGLGVSLFALGPAAESTLALAGPGAGRYALVLNGAVETDAGAIDTGGCLHIGPADESAYRAGERGAAILVMQFPPEPF
jgi:hypothetical protein